MHFILFQTSRLVALITSPMPPVPLTTCLQAACFSTLCKDCFKSSPLFSNFDLLSPFASFCFNDGHYLSALRTSQRLPQLAVLSPLTLRKVMFLWVRPACSLDRILFFFLESLIFTYPHCILYLPSVPLYRFLSLAFFFLIGVQMFYDVVLVSTVQQSRVPCAIQQVLSSYLFYTYQCIQVNPNLPIHYPSSLSPLGTHTFVLYICVSISAL